MNLRRASLTAALLVLAPLAAVPASAAADADGWHAWVGEPTGVERTGQVSRGEYVYTNGLWKALGANTDGLARTDYYAAFKPSPADPTNATFDLYNALTYDFFGAHRAAHNGDHQLPRDPETYPEGTADLSEVRLAVEGDELFVRFRWNSMPAPDAQVATLTFDGGAVAASAPWPAQARLSSAYDVALTVWGTGAALGDGTPVQARAGDHVTEARVPLSALPAGPWRLTGGAGLTDPADRSRYRTVPAGEATATAPGSGGPVSQTNVWTLLFADDAPWTFDELSQSRQLSAGAVDDAVLTVDPAVLAAGADVPLPERTGDFSRVFDSRLDDGDGITKASGIGPEAPPAGFTPPIANPGFNVSYFYTGRQQTYSMHVPDRYPATTAEWPLIVYLHGFTGLPEEPFYNPTGLVETADAQGYLLASALGRGDHYYRGEGDLDVLEVIADVSARYRVDPDRIYLMGHSMGGFGTNNVAARHPGLFAAVAPAEGTDSTELHANLRHVPWFMMTADQDLDTLAQEALAHYALLSADGYDATVLEYRAKIHEYSSIYDTLPRLFDFFGAHTRVTDPAVVTWTRPPVAEDRPELGLTYDGAYWLSEVVAEDPEALATVTVESDAVPHAAVDPAAATRTDAQVDEGGPTGRTLAQLKQTAPVEGAPVPVANRLAVTSSGASALTVDAAATRLVLGGRDLTVGSVSDVAASLTLAGLVADGERVVVDGVDTGAAQASAAGVVVALPAGEHTVVLTRSPGGTTGGGGGIDAPGTGGGTGGTDGGTPGTDGGTVTAGERVLARTGASSALAGLALLTVTAAVLLRRRAAKP